MKAIINFLFVLGSLFPFMGFSQTISQYFDGTDTIVGSSIFVELDSSSQNIWEIGSPQKTLFNQSFSQPNAIVTDLAQPYPNQNTSRFSFKINAQWFGFGILAINWTQKLDFEKNRDGGIIEFSDDNGTTWKSIFDNPYVYSFYGFNQQNIDTLANGEKAFTGSDSLWKNVWLCFDNSWLSNGGDVVFRFTMVSDSAETANSHEGWMIDNIIAYETVIHTIVEKNPDRDYMEVFPNPTNDRIHIETKKRDDFHIIEKIELINSEGKTVQRYANTPTKFFIDIGHHPEGIYLLKIQTNLKTETFQIVLNH